ncbi:DNA primase family protein [Streptacidiphilus carbonis]|uniref:DNA primase family protein n=1 Tax=Streptacidiphilus carbonis TaxID=105422 RepID=UPI000AB65BD9|nr:phage/plasmid primase, P4 family [Streptacidiphilus carbonis]
MTVDRNDDGQPDVMPDYRDGVEKAPFWDEDPNDLGDYPDYLREADEAEARDTRYQGEPPDEVDPAEGVAREEQILPSPTNPMAVARELLPAWLHGRALKLRRWHGDWVLWVGPHWIAVDGDAMRADLYPRLEHATYQYVDRKGEQKTAPWAPTSGKVGNLMEALASIVHLPSDVETPGWLAAPESTASRAPVIACRNGLLDISTRQLQPLTPLYFNRVSVPFDYVADAPVPVRWIGFLSSLWPGDPEAVLAVQEWFGYILSGRTDLQKMMLIIGPPRSGKGTIARTLTALVGKANMAGPTLAGLSTNFGLSPLLDKTLAIVSDARLPRIGTEVVVERLLSISGEDTLDVDRKYRDPWTGRIPVRFLLLSNELPAFADASGAIASRLIVLTMVNSFLGKEDRALEGDLNRELPGILNWSLDGLQSLIERGRFSEPKSSADAVAMLAASVSPIKAFLGELCTVGPEHRVPTDLLYEAWADWCKDSGRDHKGTKETFGRNLLAAVPGLRQTRPLVNKVKVRMYQGVTLGQVGS